MIAVEIGLENALTGTSLPRLRQKEQCLAFGAALQDASSVRKSANACGIAISTAFRWRHRFLQAQAADWLTQHRSIVEADEAFFRRSYEGSRCWTGPRRLASRLRVKPVTAASVEELLPVLVVRDRSRTTSDAVLADLTAETIGQQLLALLCTDTASAYAEIARDADLHHGPTDRAAG